MCIKRISVSLILVLSLFCGYFSAAGQSLSGEDSSDSLFETAKEVGDLRDRLSKIKIKNLIYNSADSQQVIANMNTIIKKTGYRIVSELSTKEAAQRKITLQASGINAFDALRLICLAGRMQPGFTGDVVSLKAKQGDDLELSKTSDGAMYVRLRKMKVELAKFSGTLGEFCKYLEDTAKLLDPEDPKVNFIDMVGPKNLTRFNIVQRQKTVLELLDLICDAKEIDYCVEPFGVVFVPKMAKKQKVPLFTLRKLSIRERLESEKIQGYEFDEMPLSSVVELVQRQMLANNPKSEKPDIRIEIDHDVLPYYAVSGSVSAVSLWEELKYACKASGAMMKLEGNTLVIYDEL